MIVGGYTLDLYCDDPQHKALHPEEFGAGGSSYAGANYRDCARQARAKGWLIKDDKAFCRVCRAAARPQETGR